MGPLEGLKVLDISFYAPVRWASMYLADLGAEVIGIEMRRIDRSTSFNTLDDDTNRRWLWYQRNKKSMTLNLKTQEGKRIFFRLAETADVVLEGFGVGTARRLGVDYEMVKKTNPEVVYCSVTGFGQNGPYAHLIGHESNYQGMGGVLAQTGERGGPPVVSASPLGDIAGGAMQAIIGVLSALMSKTRTGKGQYIDVSITDGVLSLAGASVYDYFLNGRQYARGEGLITGGRPGFGVYETKDGGYVSVSSLEPWAWEKMCHALGRDDLISYYDTETQEGEEVRLQLREVFASKTKDEWAEWNLNENVGITPVLDVAEVTSDPHMVHREMIVEMDYEPLGRISQIGIPIKFSETPGEIKWMPRYGQHTEQILTDLGYGPDDIGRLRDRAVIE